MNKDKAYYEKLDKRTKEYKMWKQQNLDDMIEEVESEGLGDTLEKVFKATGVKKVVDLFMNGKDCGCNDRRIKLNELFPYSKKAKCLEEDEYYYLKDFFARVGDTVIKEDVNRLKLIHQRVFGFTPKICVSCRSGARVIKTVMDRFKKIVALYES